MIRAPGVLDGVPLLLLGLSGENMTRLMAGEPIVVDTAAKELRGAPVQLPAMHVLIMGGRTEETIMAELHEHGIAQVMHRTPQGDGTPTAAAAPVQAHELLMRMLAAEANRWRQLQVDAARAQALRAAADALDVLRTQISELLGAPPGVGVTLVVLGDLFAQAARLVSQGQFLDSGRA